MQKISVYLAFSLLYSELSCIFNICAYLLYDDLISYKIPRSIKHGKRPKKLLDLVRDAIRVKHYAPNIEQAYVYCIKKYILFHNKRHHEEIGTVEVQAFQIHLALEEHISASAQNQLLSTLLFLYSNILSLDLGLVDSVHAKPSQHVPTVLSRAEMQACPGYFPYPSNSLGNTIGLMR
jgi:hypothetical protein